jgi:hypothetical protein
MRSILFTVLIAAGVKAGFAQNPFEADSNIACVERIAMPVYSPLAQQTRLEGTITASALLSPRGTVEKVTTDFSARSSKVTGALIRSVEDAVRGGSFRPGCGGKTVTLIFDFKIAGQPSDNPKQTDSFGYPNKFWIVVEPMKGGMNLASAASPS